MDRSHRKKWLMRLPIWGAFAALFGLAMWCNVRLMALTWTGGTPSDSAAETWYAQGLFLSLAGSGLFFCLALFCGAPRSATRPVGGHEPNALGGQQQVADHPAQPGQELGDGLWR
ncbi:hypothetical protein [Saccharopolyspora pogona]|uniref:hypothetical protein n=1 Tax=Saccharopolyspora pogona TaxID=333966 RepID=UPI00168475B5|nr:hypothetical protein [Saccharopolyspora pogona]